MTSTIIPTTPPTDVRSSVTLQNFNLSFQLRKNKRLKQARLLITPEEGLVIESPRAVSLKSARRIIQDRKDWIIDEMKIVHEQRKEARHIKKHQNSILVFGREKIVEVRLQQKRDYVLESQTRIILGFELARVSKRQMMSVLTSWLREKARKYLKIRLAQLNEGRFTINRIFVKNHKTLWGSCSSDNNINLNWRLIMAPRFASDYIIYHEMCHTKFLDHSPNFWKTVAKVCPSYKRAESWFSKYGFLLHFGV